MKGCFLVIVVLSLVGTVSDVRASLSLRLDIHTLLDQNKSKEVEGSKLDELLDEVNDIWSTCSIRFVLRKVEQHRALQLGVSYRPKTMMELSRIAEAVIPEGLSGAIPFTIAGIWNVPHGKGRLNGLGWAFVHSKGLDRVGAMMNAQKLHTKIAGPIVAHELGHTFLLGHVKEKDNLMGGDATHALSAKQCGTAQDFSKKYFQEFIM